MSTVTPPPPTSTPPGGADGLSAKKSGNGRRNAIIAAIVVVALVVAGIITWAVIAANSGASGAPGADGSDADAEIRVGLQLEPDNLDIRTTAGAALDQILIDNVYEGIVAR